MINRLKETRKRYPMGAIINRVTITAWLCFLIGFLLCGCSNQQDQSSEKIIQASLNAVGMKAERGKIQNLVSLADCMSPEGKYTTEIHTAPGGYSYFKQVYSYKPKPFEAVIENKDSGYITGDSLIALSKEAISMIRGHEFQNIILEVDKRFHDFRELTEVEGEGMSMYKLKARDEMNKEGLLFFDTKTGLLTAIHFQNPGDVKDTIKIKFSSWKKVQDLLLPWYVEIDQSGKQFSFNFINIRFNDPGFNYKKIKNDE